MNEGKEKKLSGKKVNVWAIILIVSAVSVSYTHLDVYKRQHYTTARDLAIISRAAMEREDFREIVATSRWESSDTGRIFNNKNKTISQYEGATGIKIGYTERSGRTLACLLYTSRCV